MGIDISVLMGANIASEVAAEKFCETTIGEAPEGPRSPGCLGLLPQRGSSLLWLGLRASRATHGLPIK